MHCTLTYIALHTNFEQKSALILLPQSRKQRSLDNFLGDRE